MRCMRYSGRPCVWACYAGFLQVRENWKGEFEWSGKGREMVLEKSGMSENLTVEGDV